MTAQQAEAYYALRARRLLAGNPAALRLQPFIWNNWLHVMTEHQLVEEW